MDARGTNQVFSPRDSSSSATRRASRVLPVPGGPVNVTRRVPDAPPARSLIRDASSCFRPMKLASCSGKPVGSAVRIRSRRARIAAEVARQAIVEWRIGSDRYFGAKGLAAELWLEVFARPVQRSLADLRIKVGRLSG